MRSNRNFFEERIGGSFHYQDELMDRYAWELRTEVFFRHIDVRDKMIADIGCGDGSWIREFIRRGAQAVYGVEQSERLARASGYRWTYGFGADSELMRLPPRVNIVTAITSFNFVLPRKRGKVITNIRALLKPDGILAVLDYLPDSVPDYQRGYNYKEVWTKDEWVDLLSRSRFRLRETIPVNWVDTTLFHYLGSNYPVYFVTRLLDTYFTRLAPTPKYRLLILEGS